MSTRPLGVVYLVGGGPGDPALLTVRGAELLSEAEVVVHDRLLHPSMLALTSRDAVVIDVGKRPGHGLRQEEINDILIGEAIAGRTVVRLKGGDPFVYGRGGEEAEALVAAGVRFEVVPGVTSAVAGPAYAGIPLTHRDHSSWIAVATGTHTSDGAVDWEAVARAPTVVVLMAVRNLREITSGLVEAGRDPRTPAALVSWATWPEQSTVRGELSTIADRAEAAGAEAPAVLVIGDVAALAEKLDWASVRPLSRKRVMVMRTRSRTGRLATLLRDAGADPVEVPVLRVEPVAAAGVDEALDRIGRSGWVAFTSANAVEAVASRLEARGLDARTFSGVRIAAVGAATAAALRSIGLRADLVPASATARDLAGSFPDGEGRVTFFCAHETSGDLEAGLAGRSWTVQRVVCYRTVPDSDAGPAGRQVLDEGVDAVMFTSGSTVRAFADNWGPVPQGVLVCCIGPRTAEAAAAAGFPVHCVAAEPSVEALVSALVEAVGR